MKLSRPAKDERKNEKAGTSPPRPFGEFMRLPRVA
jgi:hypothetical protein